MPGRSPGPSVEGDDRHEALRGEGRGGRAAAYGDWTKDGLEERAREIGIGGRSEMGKGGLIDAPRNH